VLDRLIIEFDRALKAVAGEPPAQRESPARRLPEAGLAEAERRRAAALMRVNHCGEVCAQALYQGQSLASSNPRLKATLAAAAREESDHLAWTKQRIQELGGRTSLLNPLWYSGSFALGYAAGKLGDAWNLGFLEETEKQVGRHLESHLERLVPSDEKTRAVVEAMRSDEAGHAQTARALGARDLPPPVKQAMRYAARIMTSTSYWV
jgi:3-demethoxyubiquinol 3-hydroxylase